MSFSIDKIFIAALASITVLGIAAVTSGCNGPISVKITPQHGIDFQVGCEKN